MIMIYRQSYRTRSRKIQGSPNLTYERRRYIDKALSYDIDIGDLENLLRLLLKSENVDINYVATWLVVRAEREIIEKTQDKIYDIAESNRKAVEFELGINIPKSVLREDFMDVIFKDVSRNITEAAENLKGEVADKLREFYEAGDEALIPEFAADLKSLVKARMETAIRTISSTIYFTTMSAYYERGEKILNKKLLYKWVNPLDERTTDICRNIVKRTENGVTMEELKEIVREESQKWNPNFWRAEDALNPHFNCRSVFVVVGEKEE